MLEQLENRDCPSAPPGNLPPSIESLAFDLAAPKTNEVLTIEVQGAADPDGDPITFQYEWLVNGVSVQTTSTPALTDSLDLSQPGFGDKGDEISVSVTPMDPYQAGPTVAASLLVANSAPVATIASYSVTHDTLLEEIDSASDADQDPLTFIIVDNPVHGNAFVNGDNILQYYPDTAWVGIDTIRLKANDGDRDSEIVTISIEVTNFAPTGTGASISVGHASVYTGIDLTEYVSDADGDVLRIGFLAQPIHGELIQNENLTYVYAPEAQFIGTDYFTIVGNDGLADSNQIVITVNVTQFAPLMEDGSYSLVHDRVLGNINFASNTWQANGNPAVIVIVTGPSHGTLSLNDDGTYDYAPESGFIGVDTVTIATFGGSDVEVAIHVTNHTPAVRKNVLNISAYDQLYDGMNLLATPTDSDNDTLTVDLVSFPEHGSLTLVSSGVYDYEAIASYVGLDSFSYRIFDGAQYSEIVAVNILVYDNSVDPTDALIQDFAGTRNQLYIGNNNKPQQSSVAQGMNAQAMLKNCWFVAATASAAHEWPTWFAANMITPNPDGTFTVNFPGANNPVSIATPVGDGNTYGTSNGIWLSVMEKAAGRYYWSQSWLGGNPYDFINVGGATGKAIPLLTGNTQDTDDLCVTWDSTTRRALTAIYANPNGVHKIVLAGTDKGRGLVGPDGNESFLGIVSGHAYSVLGFDAGTDMVTVWNPWNTNPFYLTRFPDGQTRRQNREVTGAPFQMTLHEFTRIFDDIAYEE